MRRAITGFTQDDEGHWVALLECGHRQHLRHDPPLANRPAVLTAEGRMGLVGHTLTCRLCVKGPSSAAERDADVV